MDTTHSRLITIFSIQALDLLESIAEDHDGLFGCYRLEVSISTSDALVVSSQVIRIERRRWPEQTSNHVGVIESLQTSRKKRRKTESFRSGFFVARFN